MIAKSEQSSFVSFHINRQRYFFLRVISSNLSLFSCRFRDSIVVTLLLVAWRKPCLVGFLIGDLLSRVLGEGLGSLLVVDLLGS